MTDEGKGLTTCMLFYYLSLVGICSYLLHGACLVCQNINCRSNSISLTQFSLLSSSGWSPSWICWTFRSEIAEGSRQTWRYVLCFETCPNFISPQFLSSESITWLILFVWFWFSSKTFRIVCDTQWCNTVNSSAGEYFPAHWEQLPVAQNLASKMS